MTSTSNDYISASTEQARQRFLYICNLINFHYKKSIHSLINLKAQYAGLLTIKEIHYFDFCGTSKTIYTWNSK